MGRQQAIPCVLAALLCLLPLAAPRSAHPAAPSAEIETIRRLEDRWLDALQRRDVAEVAAILSDDFLHTRWDGQLLDKASSLARLREPAKAVGAQHLTEVQVRLYGDTAVATGINEVTGTGPVVRLRFTDVFVKANGVWQAASAQETLISAK